MKNVSHTERHVLLGIDVVFCAQGAVVANIICERIVAGTGFYLPSHWNERDRMELNRPDYAEQRKGDDSFSVFSYIQPAGFQTLTLEHPSLSHLPTSLPMPADNCAHHTWLCLK